MKKIYKKPVFVVEKFKLNACVAVCNPPFSAECGVGNKQGILFEDANGSKKLDAGDRVVNNFNRNNNVGFNIYKPCGAPHDITHNQYNSMKLGFLVGTDTVIDARPSLWKWLSDADKRVRFNYDMLNQDSTDVWIWNEDYSSTQRGWHATPIQGGITTNFS